MNILKGIKKNTIVLLLITIIVLYVILKDDWPNIAKALTTMDVKYLLLAIIVFLISVSLKGIANYLIVNDKKKITVREAIKHNLITQFFNGITPFSTGGQPMEIYMLTEHNISLPKATNYTVQSFIFYQIALVICGALAVTYNFIFKIFPKVTFLKYLVLLGFAINIFVVVILLLIANSKKTTQKLSNLCKKACKKLKINGKDEEIETKFGDLYNGFKELSKNKKLSIIGIFLNILSLGFLYLIPLFVLFSMGDFTSLNVADTITASAYIYLIGAFVPIPGASGGIEYGFTQFYGNFIKTGTLSAVLLIWRFITYYLGVIIGALIFSLEKKVK